LILFGENERRDSLRVSEASTKQYEQRKEDLIDLTDFSRNSGFLAKLLRYRKFKSMSNYFYKLRFLFEGSIYRAMRKYLSFDHVPDILYKYNSNEDETIIGLTH